MHSRRLGSSRDEGPEHEVASGFWEEDFPEEVFAVGGGCDADFLQVGCWGGLVVEGMEGGWSGSAIGGLDGNEKGIWAYQ